MKLKFSVKQLFGRTETLLEEFSTQKEAENFIYNKLREDNNLKLTSKYGLYDDLGELVQEFTQKNIPSTPASSEDQARGQKSGPTSSFRPTPFNTAHQPTRKPHNTLKEEDNKKK